uniref:Integrase catalytic domain-containing protein n=1 Tax=Fagus sylvatica TaxID=28930 RepID=A0A2N9HVX1_FAGSY
MMGLDMIKVEEEELMEGQGREHVGHLQRNLHWQNPREPPWQQGRVPMGPRTVKLEFPRFRGGDPTPWVYRAMQFFQYYQIPEEEKVIHASYYLDEEALIWFQDCEHEIMNWNEFVRAVQMRFGPATYDDPMETLTKLRHTHSVVAYKGQFEALSNRIRNLSEAHKLSCFMSGLRDEVRLAVKMQGARSLGEAYALAKIQEEYLITCRKSYKPQYDGNKSNWQPSQQQQMGRSDVRIPETKPSPKPGISVQKLTPMQMSERRKQGLCYHCDEKWNPNHKCMKRRVYVIEEIEEGGVEVESDSEEYDEVIEVEEAEPGITLNALLGSPAPKTMRVICKINNNRAVILLDTGSTHNFLDWNLAKSLKLAIDTTKTFKVKVANGAIVNTKGEVEEEVVLGTQWLRTLGVISWDFEKLSMGFIHQGKQVWLQGMKTGQSRIQDSKEFAKKPVNQGLLLQIIQQPAEALDLQADTSRNTTSIRMKKGDIEKTAFRTHEGHYEYLVMPFGLTNAPSTFQALMNELLLKHHLFAKRSKCVFAAKEVEYLVHIISGLGVQTDPKKTAAMMAWPAPKTLKALRGFLGLTGYYRKFIKAYGQIAAPLTSLLKKDAFGWNEDAGKAFEQLKLAVSNPPVLALPNFNKSFVVECDASGYGIGAVLMQESRPIAYYSEGLKGKNLFLSTYEKELLALVLLVKKWRPYLLDKAFVIKTDQQSLKHLLEQRVGTPMQQKWITKLLGYPFVVEYKKGKENVVADALSRQADSELMLEIDKAGRMQENEAHPYTAAKVASLFMQNVFKLHGVPSSIVSDRDTAFTSTFWQELFTRQGTDLAMSTAYHPQTDGQTEVVNRSLEQYLRAFAADKPSQWANWLPLAEYWFNTNYHTSTKTTPFEALYGYPPPRLLEYIPGTTRVEAVDDYLYTRQQALSLLKTNLVAAQERMKLQADKNRTEREFLVGDWVYLRLQPFKQRSMHQKMGKLAPKFYGPYQILEKVGAVAYKLDLPNDALIHPVFHVSCLKAKLGQSILPLNKLPPVNSLGHITPEPVQILQQRHITTRRQQKGTEVLVQWEGASKADATWEVLLKLQQQFPHLVGKVL